MKPTVLLSRYLDRANTVYNITTDTNNNKIVDSMSFESMRTLEYAFGSFQCNKLRINQGIPSDRKMSRLLEPSEFDTPTPFSPFRIIRILDNASGVQLPAAKNVKPITVSGIPKV